MDAPISASQGAMRSLPRKLESLLSGPKHELRAEEKKKLRVLQADLQGLIDNYLIEPSEVVSPALTAHSWMKEVRDLSYDIDDFIYEVAHVVGGGARISVVKKPPRFKICRFPEKLRRRRWVTDEISRFSTRVKEAIRLHEECLGNCKWRPSSSGQPPPSPCRRLVGVDSSIQRLCGLLANDGPPEHRVVSIVGTPGVGKTTLAREVYSKLGGQFQCLAFVRTSPKPDMKWLLTSILSQVRCQRHLPNDALDVHKLVVNINEHLRDKTYLIVIEDLWALSTWDLVNRALPKGNWCSRILVTTEADVIAQTCSADNYKCIPAKTEDNSIYMPSEKQDKPEYMPSREKNDPMCMPSKNENNSMYIIKKEPLNEDESRELFSNRAFGKQAECPQSLEEVTNDIMKRSGGLPLGINILAGLLAHHPASSIEQWNYIQDSLSSDVTAASSSEKINQVLNIGYDHLPPDLKGCMLYLCLYEEDCVIWKDDLVKQWIAEGFISAVKGNDEEEVARSYFGELVNRGMIQPVDTNGSDEILSCRVHNMVLHFIRDKSMEENFCIAVDHSQTTIRLADKVRRLAIHLVNVKDATAPGPENMRLSKVRSIAFFGFHKCMPSVVEFRFLQVLNLKLLVDPDKMTSHNLTESDVLSGNITEPDGQTYNLTEISELFRLRYFHLDACHTRVALPTQLQQLKYLMAWEIDAKVTAVSSDIVDLPGLLYLRIPSEAHLPSGIGRMNSLRTLGVFDLSKNSTEDVMSLGELINLQVLRLTCSSLQPDNLEKNLECLGSVIQKLSNLKCVTLVPSVFSHVNTQNDPGASSMSTSWHDAGASSISTSWHSLTIAPLLQRLELSRRCCHFSSLPEWTKKLTNLCILKIAVTKMSKEDFVILKGLPSLTALSLFIWTAPLRRIIFGNEGFSVLKYFKFVCAAPCLEFLDAAMPNVRKLKLGFNANRMDRFSGLKHLTGLNEITIKIGDAGAVERQRERESVLTDAIGVHPSTAIINVQWVDWNFCGEDEKHTEAREEIQGPTLEQQNVTAAESSDQHGIQEKNLEDAKKQRDIRTYAEPESTIHLQNTDLKFSLIEKHTDGVSAKHEIESGGYGEIDKKGKAVKYNLTTKRHIPLSVLEEITNGFSVNSRIGRGGYGDVYKGVYNGREIAVKLLHVDTVRGLDDQQFNNEVGNLLRVKHPNIVQLIGYCYESKKIYVERNSAYDFSERIYRVLCFEYLHGGSLDKHIYGQSFAPNWGTRYNLIKGVCEGLNFLHKCEPPILHLDLKPANILLDSSMEPKLADLGLSRLFSQSHTHIKGRIRGSRKYMPPEFINEGMISPKNDIFSLGVVMIEIMTEPSGYSNSSEMDDVAQLMQQVLTNWSTVIKATSKYPSEEIHQVQTCIKLAIHCVDSERDNRPSVANILDTLNMSETHIPKRQLTDVPIYPAIGPKNTMYNTSKTMIDELDYIANKHQIYNFMGKDSFISDEQHVTDLRETTSDVEEAIIMGRTEEKKKIVATLCDSITPWFTVLPIYGIGGIGKTTLAQLVFNDSHFADYSRVWVYVSQNLDLNKIGNSIISQLSEKVDSPITEIQIIQNRLSKLLSGKKVLIVLDDVWEKNPNTLDTLNDMLRLGLGSMMKIIVTTRDEAIAEEVCHTVKPYKLENLTDKICWKIIKQKTAFKDRVNKKQLKRIGRQIATKCGGVASAAQSIGYFLNGKTSSEWESVRDNYIWNISTSEDPSSRNHEVLASLLLSYAHMPECLKLCFSYCAVFPKGHNIVKHDLIHQWIALGFTEPSSTFDPMQLCEIYITQLLEMSFLQYSKTSSSNGRQDKDVTAFTMHALVHDLATKILADQVNSKGNAGGNSCRYALLTNCSKPLQLSVTSPANIKALHFLDCGRLELHGDAFSQATCLRVLDLSECFIRKLPDSVGQLKQLRFLCAPRIQDQMIPSCITELSELNYLNLRDSRNISALPESIGDMKGLLHLDLSGCSGIHELPMSFAELKQLVHLNLSDCNMSISETFGGFTKLQYLNLSVQFTSFTEHRRGLTADFFGNLIKLRYLNLSGRMNSMVRLTKSQIVRLLGSISTLSNLEHLDLSSNQQLSSIPESIGNLRKLHTLDLSDCFNLKKLPDSMVKMVSLKVLNVESRVRLDETAHSQLQFASLPHFVVHASSDKRSSNIILLQPTNPVELMIDRLENVKSAEEAQSIKLTEKQKIEELTFQWTAATARFVDDKDVLGKLVPPSSVKKLSMTGYRSVSIPDWLIGIKHYLPNLNRLELCDFAKCNNLPPLGQLPNLELLSLRHMDGLEEWNTTYTSGEAGVNELMFPKLKTLTIEHCAKLRVKPCLPRAKYLLIQESDNVLSSHIGASFSSPITDLFVEDSKVPLYRWRLLHHLPALLSLTVKHCTDLTTSPEIIQHLSSLHSLTLEYLDQAELPRWVVELTSLQELSLSWCGSMTSLPQWLGELESLNKLEIKNCDLIRSLPYSIQQLKKLEFLTISNCFMLREWCESEENEMKLAHIKVVKFFPRPANKDEKAFIRKLYLLLKLI